MVEPIEVRSGVDAMRLGLRAARLDPAWTTARAAAEWLA